MRFLQQMTGITPILVYLEPIFYMTAISLVCLKDSFIYTVECLKAHLLISKNVCLNPIQEPKYDAALVGAVRLISVAIAASLMDKAGRKALLFTSGLCRIAIVTSKCNSLEKNTILISSFIPSGFLMFIAMLSMTMYTHKTQCNHGNLTVTEGLKSTGGLTGPAFDPITLIPLISTMVIIFGEFSWFQEVCLYTVWPVHFYLQ